MVAVDINQIENSWLCLEQGLPPEHFVSKMKCKILMFCLILEVKGFLLNFGIDEELRAVLSNDFVSTDFHQ